MGETPSKRRRQGYNAFDPNTNPMAVVTAYENPTKSKEIPVRDMQKIVDANKKILKEFIDEHN